MQKMYENSMKTVFITVNGLYGHFCFTATELYRLAITVKQRHPNQEEEEEEGCIDWSIYLV